MTHTRYRVRPDGVRGLGQHWGQFDASRKPLLVATTAVCRLDFPGTSSSHGCQHLWLLSIFIRSPRRTSWLKLVERATYGRGGRYLQMTYEIKDGYRKYIMNIHSSTPKKYKFQVTNRQKTWIDTIILFMKMCRFNSFYPYKLCSITWDYVSQSTKNVQIMFYPCTALLFVLILTLGALPNIYVVPDGPNCRSYILWYYVFSLSWFSCFVDLKSF